MKANFFIAIAISCFPAIVFAQKQQATTENGRKVILYDDGTWKYADAPKENPTRKPEELKKEEPKKTETVLYRPVVDANCSEFIEVVEDSRTRISTTKTKNFLVISHGNDKKEIDIMMQKGARDVVSITFKPVGAGDCITEGSKINIQFTDGSRLDLAHDGFANCIGQSTVNFGGSYGRRKVFDQLKSKPIRSIRVWAQNGVIQEEFSKEEQTQFIQLLNCVSQ